jgi:hypothetical protein
MFAAAGRQGLVRVNQELDAGPHDSKRVKTVYYEVCIPGMLTHTVTQLDLEPGSYGIKTVSTRFYPYRPASLPVSIPDGFREFDTAEKKVLSCSKILHRFRFCSGISIDPALTALTWF